MPNEFYKDKRYKNGIISRCKNCLKEYRKIWDKNNKEKIKKQTKLRLKKRQLKYPFYNRYNTMKQRCNNPNVKGYKWYGGKGIKMLMTMKDIKYLWFRDKGYNMKKPSIDRKNNDGHYTLENCRFMELSENIKRREE